MDAIVRQAMENLQAVHVDANWVTLPPNERISLIYGEIRRLDLERVAGRSTQDPNTEATPQP
jgi:hypothetical protein